MYFDYKMIRLILNLSIAAIFIINSSCTKEKGCIDPNASNYSYDAKKDDGSCLFDMSFWMNSAKHGPVYIFVDGKLRDSLFCYWTAKTPRCGVDTFIYFASGAYSCTANIPLESGNHNVRVEALDGTIWEESYYLPENCLRVLINPVNNSL